MGASRAGHSCGRRRDCYRRAGRGSGSGSRARGGDSAVVVELLVVLVLVIDVEVAVVEVVVVLTLVVVDVQSLQRSTDEEGKNKYTGGVRANSYHFCLSILVRSVLEWL